jgi:hypothetical protein
MTPSQRFRRTTTMLFWRLMNPAARRLAGIAPFWVVLETTGRWRSGTATVLPWDEGVARRFNRYARLGPTTLGIDPALVRVDLR